MNRNHNLKELRQYKERWLPGNGGDAAGNWLINTMQFVGFLKEHEKNSLLATKSISQMSSFERDKVEMEKVAYYLENSTVLAAFLHYVFDSEKKPIAPYILYTDGERVWSSHYSSYLRRGNFFIPDDFINYIKWKNFIPDKLTKEQLQQAEIFFINSKLNKE